MLDIVSAWLYNLCRRQKPFDSGFVKGNDWNGELPTWALVGAKPQGCFVQLKSLLFGVSNMLVYSVVDSPEGIT